jgi:uncharacterized membrane protein YdjX (TVP38/TMEM64 family)
MEPSSDSAPEPVSWPRRLLPLAILLALAGLIVFMGWHRHLSLEGLAARREALKDLIDAHGPISILAFIGVYIFTVALSLPGAVILTIAGGFLFGWIIGSAASVVAATIGGTILFLIARSAFGEALAARAGRRLNKLRKGFSKDAFNYLLFLRLVPLFPFWLVNLAPALLGVPLRTFVLATAIGVVPGTIAFAIAGAGLDSVIAAQMRTQQLCLAREGPHATDACPFALQPGAILTPELLAAFAALGLVALLPILLRRWRKRQARKLSA